MKNFIPCAKQSINDEDIEAVTAVLKSDFLTRGPLVKEFEEAIANYTGAKYAVAFNSATSGLSGACYAAEVGAFDKLLIPSNTYIGTVAGGCQCGAEPVFIDIEEKTGNLDLNQLNYSMEKPLSRGRYICLPVHFSGQPVDMEKLSRSISDPNTVVIEDAAHALGSRYSNGKKVGACTYSDMTVFSFHPAKNITTGEGGIVTTNDEEYYHRLRLFRDNGVERDSARYSQKDLPWYYEVVDVTGNSHMTELGAALGLSQLQRLERFAKKRRELVGLYKDELKHVKSLDFLEVVDNDSVHFHLCVVFIDFDSLDVTREELMTKLKEEEGIGTQVHYIPLYRHPYFKNKYGDLSSYFPGMESYYKKALSLPLYPAMTKREIKRVVKSLKSFL